MDKVNLDDSLRAALVELQEYLKLQARYNKMLLAKKLGEIISHLALFIIVIGISGFLLIFISFAFVVWFNQFDVPPYTGHLIVAGFYLFLALFTIVFRKPLIFAPVRKLFGQVLFGDDEDHSDYEEVFKKTESLNLRIRKYKKALQKKEEKLGSSFDKLSKKFTIANIFQTIARNAYNSFVTTSNIARTAYSLIKSITGKKKRKVKKRRRDSSPEIEENNN